MRLKIFNNRTTLFSRSAATSPLLDPTISSSLEIASRYLLTGILVAEGFFQTLGVEPSLGRLFRSQEFVKHASPCCLAELSVLETPVSQVIAALLDGPLT
jgi:hypothetical protein